MEMRVWRENWVLDGYCPFIVVGTSIAGDVRSKLTVLPFTVALGRLGRTIKCSRGYTDSSRALGALESVGRSYRENWCFLM